MTDIARVTYKNTTITYSEGENEWIAEHEHEDIGKAESLTKAKALVDRWIKEEDTFERHPALYAEYNNQPVEVIVTSLCKELDWQGKKQAWISIQSGPHKGSRKKARLEELLADTPGNRELSAQMLACAQIVKEQQKQSQKLLAQMTPYTVPKAKAK